jgi:bacterioferritin
MSAQNSDREQKKAKVIEVLNAARAMELHAIHQYMNHHYILDDQDYGDLAKKMRAISIDEMRHAEWLAERIMDLDGEPTSRIDGQVVKGQSVREMYAFDRQLEDDTLEKYNAFLITCRECGDYVSSSVFQRIILQEQDHWDYFDDTDNHITELGNHFMGNQAATGDAD